MAYLGASAQQFVGLIGVSSQSFNGDGLTVAFTLNQPVNQANELEVLVNNVQQSPFDGSYFVDGTTLSFSEAPSTGTNNIYVVYRTVTLGGALLPNESVTTSKLADGSVATSKLADGSVTTSKIVNAGVTAQKIASGAAISNLGFTPVNRSGDTMTGDLQFNDKASSTTYAFSGKTSYQWDRSSLLFTSWDHTVIAGGTDVNGTSGNAWSIDSAAGQGLFNLIAGAYHDGLTTNGTTAGNTFKYFGTRGASRLALMDAAAEIHVGSLPSGGGQVAGDTVTFILAQAYDQYGLNGRGTASGRLGGNIQSFHFERNGVGTAATFMSHGNGAAVIAGIRMPFAGRVIQGTLYGDAFSGTITVDVAVNGTPNTSYRMSISASGGNAGVNGDWQGSMLSFAAGDVIGMYQTTVPSAADGYTVALFVQFD